MTSVSLTTVETVTTTSMKVSVVRSRIGMSTEQQGTVTMQMTMPTTIAMDFAAAQAAQAVVTETRTTTNLVAETLTKTAGQ